MKTINILLLLLCFGSACARDEKRVGLAFAVTDSRDRKETLFMEKQITFYHVADSQSVLRLSCSGYRRDVIDSLPAGTYTIMYLNNTGQQTKRNINIPPVDSFCVVLAVDSLQSYRASRIDQVHNGETVLITLYSQGCFHGYGKHIIIDRRKGKLRASLYKSKGKRSLDASKSPAGKLLQRVSLDESRKAAYARFENELQAIPSGKGSCTTTDSYTISSPYLNLSKDDDSCEWNGFYYLERALFGDME